MVLVLVLTVQTFLENKKLLVVSTGTCFKKMWLRGSLKLFCRPLMKNCFAECRPLICFVFQTPEEENQLKAKKQFREDLKVFDMVISIIIRSLSERRQKLIFPK